MRLAVVLVLSVAAVGYGDRVAARQRMYACSLGPGEKLTDLPLPTLAPPPGVLARSGSRASSVSSFSCGSQYDSPASTTELSDHFSNQMTAAGWKAAGRNDEASVSVRLYAGTSSSGSALTAHVIVTTLEETPAKDVVLHIVRHDAPGDESASRPSGRRSGGAGASARGDDAAILPTLRGMLYAAAVAGPGETHKETGTLPPGFPKELLPEGTIVRLAAVSPTYQTVVGVSPSLTVFGIPPHLVAVNKAGWLGRAPTRGFMGAGVGPMLRPVQLCRQAEAASIELVPLDSGGVAVRAGYIVGSTIPCGSGPALTGGFPDVAIPILAPTGVTARGSSGGGGLNDFRSAMRGLATVPRETTAKELATQLTKGGWKVTREVSIGNVSIIRGRNTSSAGDPVTALVSITEIVGTPFVDLCLRVVRHKPASPVRGGN